MLSISVQTLSIGLNHLAEIYIKQGKTDSAEIILNKVIAEKAEINQKTVARSYMLLSSAFEYNNEFKKAYSYHKKYKNLLIITDFVEIVKL